MWGVIFALQSCGAVHLGVDNLGVVRHVGRLLDGRHSSVPFELVDDGDLLLLIDRMLHLRALDTVRITKVKGHADEGMVLDGRVREVDRLGNNSADEAADFGCRRVGSAVIDARRNLSGVCGRWYHVILSLLRFSLLFLVLWLIMIGVEVLLLIPFWFRPKRRRLVHAVRDRAFLPGPPGIWDSEWVLYLLLLYVLLILLIGPTLLVFWLSGLLFLVLFIGLLGVLTLVLVVSLMLSCSFFMSFGLVRDCLWRRLILGSYAVSLLAGDWRGLSHAPLVLITVGSVILGGRNVVMVPLLDLGLFRYPPGSGCALLAGTLPLRCCSLCLQCSHLAVTGDWSCCWSGHCWHWC